MDEIAVSVIIPVYNSEPYLRQCLDSVTAQTLKNIEIICVDDGSTDHSVEILKEYAARDPRFTILCQQNRYAGVARNTGKAHAHGKYLVFWDSDDYFHPSALQKMFAKCEADKADICVCGGRDYYEKERFEAFSSRYVLLRQLPARIPFNRETNPKYILSFTNASVWNKMFRRSFVESARLDFHPSKNANDVFFVENALCLAGSVTVVRDYLICYRNNKDFGLVHRLEKKGIDVAFEEWYATAVNLRRLNVFPESSFANKALDSIFYVINNTLDFEAYKEGYEKLQSSYLDTMGIRLDVEDGYYHSPFLNDAAHHLHSDSAEQFLKWYSSYVSQSRTLTSARLRYAVEKLHLQLPYKVFNHWRFKGSCSR